MTSHNVSNCLVIQYTDDTQFIHTGNVDRIQDLICRGEETLSKTKRYFHLNDIMLNTKKGQCIFTGSRVLISQLPQNVPLQVDDSSIMPSTSLKNLGVYCDLHLTFETHINNISKKVFSTIMYINRIKENLTETQEV